MEIIKKIGKNYSYSYKIRMLEIESMDIWLDDFSKNSGFESLEEAE